MGPCSRKINDRVKGQFTAAPAHSNQRYLTSTGNFSLTEQLVENDPHGIVGRWRGRREAVAICFRKAVD